MDRQDCQFLIDLYETQNITQVARKYFLTQPALTKRLQRLEEELGCQLLIRHKKGVSFTAAGELTLPYCRSMLHCGEALLGALNSHRGIVGGSLKLLCSHSYSYRQLPQALKLYCQRYPMVNVEISVGRSAPLYQQFLRQENCIAILRGDWTWSGGYVPLRAEPLCLLRSRDRVHLPLDESDYISGGSDDHAAITQMERWAQEQGLSLHASRLHVNNINCCKELVRQGLGWSILPGSNLQDFDGVVTPLYLEEGVPLKRSTSLLYHNSYAQLPQVRLFIDTLLESEALSPAPPSEMA